jgi:hypothetical protein
MFNKSFLSAMFAGLMLLGAAQADAGVDGWTSYFNIEYLDSSSTGAGEGYSVKGPGDFTGSLSNPANCTGSLTYAYVSTADTTATKRDMINKTLLSAFLAGKQVRLYMIGTKCSGGTTAGSPLFKDIAVH